MRISTSQFYQSSLFAINSQQSRLMHIYQQIGSGSRLATPADDPLAAAQSVNLSQSQGLNQRLAENRELARRDLGAEENTLDAVTLLLQAIKTRLIEAGNGAISDADRATLGDVLAHARTSLLGLANATDGSGQYLFSGSRGDTAPFQQEGGGIVYMGDALQRHIQADHTRRMPGGDVGTDVFARAAPGETCYLTRGEPGNTGTCVIGKPSITSAAAGAGNRYVLTFTSASQFNIVATDANGDETARVEGLPYVSGEAGAVALPDGIQVFLEGQPRQGDAFVVEPAASPDTDLNIFDTLDRLIEALQANVSNDPVAAARLRNALGSAMQRIDVNYDNVLTILASVGARLNELDAMDAIGAQRAQGYDQQLSRLEDLDFYSASMQLQLKLSALEAASLAFQKIRATNLFNLNAN